MCVCVYILNTYRMHAYFTWIVKAGNKCLISFLSFLYTIFPASNVSIFISICKKNFIHKNKNQKRKHIWMLIVKLMKWFNGYECIAFFFFFECLFSKEKQKNMSVVVTKFLCFFLLSLPFNYFFHFNIFVFFT